MVDLFTNLPHKHFGCIVADPPWRFNSRTALQMQNPGSRRDAERHYPVMTWQEIAALPVGDLAHKASHLWLWVTGPCLPQAFPVMEAWGFTYSAIGFVWIKTRRTTRQLRMVCDLGEELHVGLGLTTRHNAELCLLGRRPAAKRKAKDIREVIVSPRREHSRKPDEAYARIERYCEGPYLDLFSRQERPRWTPWGNEIDRFIPAEAAE